MTDPDDPQSPPSPPRRRPAPPDPDAPKPRIEELPGMAPKPRARVVGDPAGPPPLAPKPPRPPVRRPPPASAPPIAPPPPDAQPRNARGQGDDLYASPSRGFAFYFMAAVFSIGLIGGIVLGLREALNRGYLEQYKFIYDQVSLMPSRSFRSSASEENLQVFLSNDGATLATHVRRLRRNVVGAEKDQLVLQELFTPSDPNLFRTTLPDGCKLRGFYRVGAMAYLDVTKEFQKPAKPSPRGERVAVYSLVNSVVLNNPDIDGLQILVEGKPIDSAWGWLDCSAPLGADLSLVR